MFSKFTDILSGKTRKLNRIYDTVTQMVGPSLPNDPQVLTTFFVLQRAVDRVIYANGATPLLNCDVRSIQPDSIIKLMDIHSGFMRRAAQLKFIGNFELLDNLAYKIFPNTAANSLAIFDHGNEYMPPDIRLNAFTFGPTWKTIALPYLAWYCGILNVEANFNQPQVDAFISGGESQLQSDLDLIMKGDPLAICR